MQKLTWNGLKSLTASHRSDWQYCNPLEQEQKKAYKPSLHWGWVHPESGSTPVIINKWHQGCHVEGITHFSNTVIRRIKMWQLHLGLMRGLKCKCNSKHSFPEEVKNVFFRVFMRNRTSRIWVFLVLGPCQHCPKILKKINSCCYHVAITRTLGFPRTRI